MITARPALRLAFDRQDTDWARRNVTLEASLQRQRQTSTEPSARF